jgi:hypothetical protein
VRDETAAQESPIALMTMRLPDFDFLLMNIDAVDELYSQ